MPTTHTRTRVTQYQGWERYNWLFLVSCENTSSIKTTLDNGQQQYPNQSVCPLQPHFYHLIKKTKLTLSAHTWAPPHEWAAWQPIMSGQQPLDKPLIAFQHAQGVWCLEIRVPHIPQKSWREGIPIKGVWWEPGLVCPRLASHIRSIPTFKRKNNLSPGQCLEYSNMKWPSAGIIGQPVVQEQCDYYTIFLFFFFFF